MKIIEIDTDCNTKFLVVLGYIGDFIRGRLGGYMEVVHPKGLITPFVMIVDEEGLLKELPLNPAGSIFYGTPLHGQPIVGKIYIAKQTGNPLDGDDIKGLTDDDMAEFTRLYGCGITHLKLARRDGKI
jgi:hypothetical protein